MAEIALIVFVLLSVFMIITKVSNHIPKTGRSVDAKGDGIEAEIINEIRTAEKPATMKLRDENGNDYRVKLKESEARLWIKGDKVKVIFSEDKKTYRVLFNDYFRNNEKRIKEAAVKKIAKINPKLFAARLTGFNEESSEILSNSGADSLTLFAFLTYMRRIAGYSIFSIVMTAFFLGWYNIFLPKLKDIALPIVMLIIAYYVLYSAVMSCKRILEKYTK